MIRAQQYIQALMENVAEGQISSDDFRMMFAKIGRRLAEAHDLEDEMRRLYKVPGFSNFALALMWVAERVESDPSKLEYTSEEQSFVVTQFRFGTGDLESPPMGESPVMETETQEVEFTPVSEVPEPPAALEETPEMPAQLQMETSGPIDESEKAVYAPPPGPASGSEGEFAGLMEKFVEAMQSGSDERDGLVQSVLAQSNALLPEGSGVPDDLREFCGYLVEFLNYITENGFMDDVRVMNILSNVSGPVASWAQAPPDGRVGVLAEGTEILRTFKSLFE
ncbi:MAG: hypothetical protein WEB33_11750 [Bacteroidota bacterium]